MEIPFEETSRHAALAAEIARSIGADAVTIQKVQRLTSGASGDRWRLDVLVTGGPHSGAHHWQLHTVPPTRLPLSLDRASEAKVLHVALSAGVRIAELIAMGDHSGELGQPYAVHRFVPGAPVDPQGLLDPAAVEPRPSLESTLAGELAKIHAITPQCAQLSFLPIPAQPPARVQIARLREALGKSGEPRPALEYVLSWLDARTPPARGLTLVHGDFRTGNHLVDAGALTAILDWQFAHWGDPDEDIGCLTARLLRDGYDAVGIGGLAPLGNFRETYEAASGRKVAPDAVRYWQIMAAARHAVIAVLQGDRFRIGGEARLELALAGLTPAEFEYDALAGVLAWTRGNGGPRWQA